jgi:type IV secretion system protein TrbE
MFIGREARQQAKGFSDLLDYSGLVSDGVLATNTGVYIAAYQFEGKDMDALSPDECYQIANKLKDSLRLGAGWGIQCDLIRSEYAEYAPQEAEWSDPVPRMVEEERRWRFNIAGQQGATRLSRTYLSLTYEANSARDAARKLMGINDESPLTSDDAELDKFINKLEEIEAALWNATVRFRRLKGYFAPVGEIMQHRDELCEFVRELISGERYPFAVPHTNIDFNQWFAVNDLGFVEHERQDESGKRDRVGVRGLELGDPLNEILPGKCIRVLAVDCFPEESFAGMMREFDLVDGIDFRLQLQAIILDDVTAAKIHKNNKGKWKFKGNGGLKGQVKGPSNDDLDIESLRLSADAGQAKSAAEHGRETYCRFAARIILMNSDVTALVEASRVLAQRMRHCGFTCRIETVNAVASWLASMVGQAHKDTRQSILTTENLTHMMPLSQPFMGHLYNPSPYFPTNSPPLFYALTGGSSPYRFNGHVEDVGHVLIVGPSGAGKTTKAALGMVQALRYKGSQVFAFDKKKTLYTLTKCVGGDFYDLSPTSDTKLCPLAELSTSEDRQWAEQWVAMLVEMNNLVLTPDVVNDIRSGIERISKSRATRSLNDLHLHCSLPELKQALEFYLGTILDGEEDGLHLSRFTVFEMDRLYALDKKLMNGALFYIFWKIRKRLRSDVPTFMFVDEFRAALSHPLAAKAFTTYLFEGRALNLAVWLVVQELGETLASPLKGAVLEQIFTKVCLPNPQAALEARHNYEALGCNRADILAIASATTKHDYYVMQPAGKRIISLEIGNVLKVLLKSGDQDREALDALIQQFGRQQAIELWFRRHKEHEWADYYRTLAGIGQEAAMEAANYAHK